MEFRPLGEDAPISSVSSQDTERSQDIAFWMRPFARCLQTTSEELDGSTWTEVGNVNNPRSALAASGRADGALAFGGAPGTKANTESWNGTSWTEVNDLGNARNRLAASSTASASSPASTSS